MNTLTIATWIELISPKPYSDTVLLLICSSQSSS